MEEEENKKKEEKKGHRGIPRAPLRCTCFPGVVMAVDWKKMRLLKRKACTGVGGSMEPTKAGKKILGLAF